MSQQRTWREANRRHVMASLARVRAALARHVGEEPPAGVEEAVQRAGEALDPPGTLERIASAFGLDPFERDLLLLAAGPELDGSFGGVVATALGEARSRRPTLGLALAALPGAHWSAISPAAPLRRFGLLRLDPGSSLTTRPVSLDERVLHYLLGVSYLPPQLEALLRSVAPPAALAPSRARIVQVCAEHWSQAGPSPVLVLVGREVEAMESTAAAAARAVGASLWRLRAEDVPRLAAERHELLRRFGLEMVLERSILLVDLVDAGPEALQAATAFVEDLPGPAVVATRDGARFPHRPAVRLEISLGTVPEQRQAWQQALGAGATPATVDRFAGTYDLTPEAILRLGQRVARHAEPADPLWQVARDHTRPRMASLAQPITSGSTWQDLVLPEPQVELLRGLTAQVRNRATVYERWGFSRGSSRGLGIAGLFAGPSGTGKTLAAEVIANELQLDLFRIDLSAVVSKYIGETEKNLRRIFDAAEAGGSVLLFDEADALFGKRSDVKDSHDRYANIEVSYLLQRIESYRGLAILTTNLKRAVDQAFLRRFRFVVDFPFPDARLRALIWSQAFPAQAPTHGLDIDRLATMDLTGGNIRNIAVGAAFLAADAGEPVGMHHIERAARSEYLKLGRSPRDLRLGARP